MTLPTYARYWGKSDHNEPRLNWRPYVEHVATVALVTRALLLRSPPLKKLIAERCRVTEDQVENLICWAAINHDLGKLHAYFQWKYPKGYEATYADVKGTGWSAEESKKNGKFDTPGNIPRYYHGTGGYVWAEDYAQIPGWRKDIAPILKAAAAHHGSFPSDEDAQGPSEYRLATRFASKQPVLIQDMLAMREFYAETLKLFSPPKVTLTDPRILTPIAGLISVADWLGSDENFAPLRENWNLRTITEAWNCPELRERADKVVDHRFRPFVAPTGSMVAPPGGFSELQNYTGGLADKRLVIIEAPTGDGKTEAALNLVQTYFKNGVVDRMFFGLPTKATANAMHSRVKRFAKELFGTPNGKPMPVGLAHGDAARYVRNVLDVGRKNNQGLGDDDASNFGDKWYRNGKRGLLQQLAVGTIDQALKSALKNRHHFVSAYPLSTAVIVIDEVHAVDAFMGSHLCHVLRTLSQHGARVILLSATLTAELRANLVDAWGGAMPATSLTGYPIVTSIGDAGTSVEQRTLPSRRAVRSVEVQAVPFDWDDPDRPSVASDGSVTRMVDSLVQTVKAGACACWIRNTVKDTQTAYRQATKLLPKDQVVLLHAGFQLVDRQHIEAKIIKNFGPKGQRPPMLVIGTQILEQSLDVDFDRLVRDITTIDGLIQALGRCHRHGGRTRPAGYQSPKLEVFVPKAGFIQGSKSHYEFIHEGRLAPLSLTLDLIVKRSGTSVLEPVGVPGLIGEVFDVNSLSPLMKVDQKTTFDSQAAAGAGQVEFKNMEVNDVGAHRAQTRDGDGSHPFLFVEQVGSGQLRIRSRLHGACPVIDLRPIKDALRGIPGAYKIGKGTVTPFEARVFRAALHSTNVYREWDQISDIVADHLASRATLPEGQVTVSHGKNRDAAYLAEILRIGRVGSFHGVAVIPMATYIVTRKIEDKIVGMYRVEYTGELGMTVEKLDR